jgi:hypothetical protein
MSVFREHAPACWDRGYSVIPTEIATKHPAKLKGLQDTSPPPDEEMPAFMKAAVGNETTDFEPEDLPWMGDKGGLDYDQLLAKLGHDQLSPLEYILLALIDAHQAQAPDPKSKNSPEREVIRKAQLEIALGALTGRLQRKRGMDEKDDYELLIQIAWGYHCRFWANDRTPPPIEPIIRACVEALPPQDPRRKMAEISSVVSRLRKKFLKNKDLLLVRAAEQRNFRRMDQLRELETILLRMRGLGIPIRPQRAAPAHRQSGCKTPPIIQSRRAPRRGRLSWC